MNFWLQLSRVKKTDQCYISWLFQKTNAGKGWAWKGLTPAFFLVDKGMFILNCEVFDANGALRLHSMAYCADRRWVWDTLEGASRCVKMPNGFTAEQFRERFKIFKNNSIFRVLRKTE